MSDAPVEPTVNEAASAPAPAPVSDTPVEPTVNEAADAPAPAPVSDTQERRVEETAPAVEMTSATPARSASDAYVFAAVLCAVVGIVIPVIPAAAALMLVRATDADLTNEPLRPGLAQLASFARGLAWFDLAWMSLATIAFLLGTLGKVIS